MRLTCLLALWLLPLTAEAAGGTPEVGASPTASPTATPTAAPTAPPKAAGAADVPLATPTEVSAWIGRVHSEVGRPVLIAAAGPDAERLAIKVAEALAPGQVRVLRIGFIGDPAAEMERALSLTGMACGIRLGTTTAATWTVATFGNCGTTPVAIHSDDMPEMPDFNPAPPPAPAATTGAGAAAVATIPGLEAALPGSPAPAAAAAPVTPPAPYVPPPPLPPDPSVLAATYRLVALTRVDDPAGTAGLGDAAWLVRDGRGRTLTALEFAHRTGDLGAEHRIARDGGSSRAVGLGLAIGGGALAVTALGLAVARDAGAPSFSDYEPSRSDFRRTEKYEEAYAQAEADFSAAQDAHAIVADDRLWIAAFLGGAGVLAIGSSPLASRGAADRQHTPALYWDPAAADALIGAYNGSVRQRLGLPDEGQPTKVVVAPPPDEDAGEHSGDDDLDEEPIEDSVPEKTPDTPPRKDRGPAGAGGAGPAGGSTPAGGQLMPDLGPTTPMLHVSPVLGFGWAGVTGTF
jgi:hypothetical protein